MKISNWKGNLYAFGDVGFDCWVWDLELGQYYTVIDLFLDKG
jgi:hypothetical protein